MILVFTRLHSNHVVLVIRLGENCASIDTYYVSSQHSLKKKLRAPFLPAGPALPAVALDVSCLQRSWKLGLLCVLSFAQSQQK